MKKFTIGGVNEHFNYPWRYAIEQNYFLDKGIAIQWQDIAGGTGEMIERLQSGTLDLAVMLTEGFFKQRVDNTKLSLLQFHVNSPLRWGIHVSRDSSFNSASDLQSATFAISRFNSGSHLMVLALAKENNWNLNENQFVVVHSLEGGLNALKNNQADVFLWEKFTTAPFLDDYNLKAISEISTPWPPFSFVANTQVRGQFPNEIETIATLICKTAYSIKNDANFIAKIAQRYQLTELAVSKWMNELEWNYQPGLDLNEVHTILHNLCMTSILSKSETTTLSKQFSHLV